MTLGEKQRLFALFVGKLIFQAYGMGYEVTLGDAHRSVEEATRLGKPNSLHTKRLAIDLNLFRDGVYLTATDDHAPLGTWWEQQHALASWGGRFGDGNHYSFMHGGVR